MLIGARNLMLCPKKITSSVRSSRSSCLTSARTSSRRSRHSAALYNGFDINLTRRSSLASSNAGHRSAVSRGLRDAACCCVLIGVCLGLALSKLGLQGQPKGTERCPQPAHVHPARYNDFDINLILLFFLLLLFLSFPPRPATPFGLPSCNAVRSSLSRRFALIGGRFRLCCAQTGAFFCPNRAHFRYRLVHCAPGCRCVD